MPCRLARICNNTRRRKKRLYVLYSLKHCTSGAGKSSLVNALLQLDYQVRADGLMLTREPATVLPMA